MDSTECSFCFALNYTCIFCSTIESLQDSVSQQSVEIILKLRALLSMHSKENFKNLTEAKIAAERLLIAYNIHKFTH